MAGNYGKHGPLVEAKAEPEPSPKSKAKTYVEVRQADNGGFIVRLCRSTPGEYHEPDEYAVGKDEGGEVLAMVGKHLGIKGSAEESREKEHKG